MEAPKTRMGCAQRRHKEMNGHRCQSHWLVPGSFILRFQWIIIRFVCSLMAVCIRHFSLLFCFLPRSRRLPSIQTFRITPKSQSLQSSIGVLFLPLSLLIDANHSILTGSCASVHARRDNAKLASETACVRTSSSRLYRSWPTALVLNMDERVHTNKKFIFFIMIQHE